MAKRGSIGLLPVVGPLGAWTLGGGDGEADSSDFRNTPSSDRTGGYADRGKLGEYSPDQREPYRSPEGVRHFSGYGCDERDYERGHIVPGIREDPAYDKTAYQDRYTAPRVPDEDMGETNRMADDWKFRDRARKSRGFLTRPRIPTERN